MLKKAAVRENSRRIAEAAMKKNKSGSYVIFATILFSSMMILTTAVLYVSGENAISSATDSFGRLWGRSVLAEYDRNLKDRYGIFAFYGDKKTIEEKLNFYAAYSFDEKEYIDAEASKCSIDEYRLTEKENFLAQVKAAVAADTKPLPIKSEVEEREAAKQQSEEQSRGAKSSLADSKSIGNGTHENRYIKNKRIIKSLPSGGKGGSVGILSLIEKLKNDISFGSLADEATENVYLFRFFKDCMNDRDLGETFFDNEIEYVLSGKLSDEKAKKKIGNDLIILRNGLNLVYLYSCEEKRNAVLAVAELLFPAAPLASQALIMESWAYMEARNDLKLLYAGKQVPLMKKDENWAISLENLLAAEYGCDSSGAQLAPDESYSEPKSYLPPAKIEGKDYEAYLRILAAALPQETAIARMMDLIQINMKYLYCDYFLVSDYHVGLKYSITVNNRRHEFEEKY